MNVPPCPDYSVFQLVTKMAVIYIMISFPLISCLVVLNVQLATFLGKDILSPTVVLTCAAIWNLILYAVEADTSHCTSLRFIP